MKSKAPNLPDLTKLRAEVIRRSYAIEIEVADFIAIDSAESDYKHGGLGNKTILDQITSILRSDVEYNGHFGSYIYFTMDVEDDTKRNHGKVLTIIRNQIIKARCYVARKEKASR